MNQITNATHPFDIRIFNVGTQGAFSFSFLWIDHREFPYLGNAVLVSSCENCQPVCNIILLGLTFVSVLLGLPLCKCAVEL